MLRSYVLGGNTAHYDGVIAALEAKGLRVIPAFACGLDSRPAIEAYFMRDGVPTIDALVSLTGFSLVGGPAYNDSLGGGRGHPGAARRALSHGPSGRIPDDRAMAGRCPRPARRWRPP